MRMWALLNNDVANDIVCYLWFKFLVHGGNLNIFFMFRGRM